MISAIPAAATTGLEDFTAHQLRLTANPLRSVHSGSVVSLTVVFLPLISPTAQQSEGELQKTPNSSLDLVTASARRSRRATPTGPGQ